MATMVQQDPALEGFMPAWWRRVLGVFHVGLAVALGYLLVEFWPVEEPDASGALPDASISVAGLEFTLDPELQLIVIVMIAAGIGSYAHAATSFAAFAGARRLEKAWVWWYALRPFIGASLALTLYFLTRGGLLSTGSDAGDLNPYGIAGVSALAGMFSKQATAKLKEVFDTFFAVANEPPMAGPLDGR